MERPPASAAAHAAAADPDRDRGARRGRVGKVVSVDAAGAHGTGRSSLLKPPCSRTGARETHESGRAAGGQP